MTERARFWEDLRSGRFVSMVEESSKGQSVANSKEVYNIMKPLFAKEDDVEKVYFIFLDAQNKILSIENLFTGTISASTIYPRELIKRLLALKSCAYVMVHNHPSGNTTPSEEDIAITMKLAVASSGIDVLLHDHIIIGDGLYSMADMGLMKKIKNKCNNLLATVNQL